jgi:hypothetical protein
MKKSTLDDYQVHGIRNEVIVGHSKILLWDLINKKQMDLKEATNSLKALLYDDGYPNHSLRKAELVDLAVEELAAVGLLKTIKGLKEKWTNDDGTVVTLEDYMNDMGYTSDEPSRLEAMDEHQPLFKYGEKVWYDRANFDGGESWTKIECVIQEVHVCDDNEVRYTLTSGYERYDRIDESYIYLRHTE